MRDTADGPLRRVLREAGGPGILDRLVALPGADLTTLLLAAVRRRAARLEPADVLRRYRTDRFVAPATVDFHRLRRVEGAVLAALPAGFEAVTLAPVAPLGTHSVLSTVDQNKVVSTLRGSEVAADPTNGLALEAAVRRRADPAATARLFAIQRVLRAQRFPGAAGAAHFTLAALATAGRDTGGYAFARQHLAEHLGVLLDAVRRACGGAARIALTVLDRAYVPVLDDLAGAGLPVEQDPAREAGRGYYTGLCFKLYAEQAGQWVEVADGGLVGWTAALLADRKERLLISGLGVDRLATFPGAAVDARASRSTMGDSEPRTEAEP
ncbi:MAG: ATP phosphoribosyltransferase regulatory subunit [Micromonosporaceae bacterium]|nr:ATP phosphoribosyltransferase regulatory subunit [Micromonosporaceae bacterium]